jgi:hypothetical protein
MVQSRSTRRGAHHNTAGDTTVWFEVVPGAAGSPVDDIDALRPVQR